MNFYDAIKLFEKVNKYIIQDVKISAYCVGGIAVSYWVGPKRVTGDIDVVFSQQVNTDDLFIEENGKRIGFDSNFNDTLSALQEDYQGRAKLVTEFEKIKIYVISPEDLSIMKMSRWNEQDRRDVILLIENRLLNKELLSDIFEDVSKVYIGNYVLFKYAFDDIIEVITNFEKTNQIHLPLYMQNNV